MTDHAYVTHIALSKEDHDKIMSEIIRTAVMGWKTIGGELDTPQVQHGAVCVYAALIGRAMATVFKEQLGASPEKHAEMLHDLCEKISIGYNTVLKNPDQFWVVK